MNKEGVFQRQTKTENCETAYLLGSGKHYGGDHCPSAGQYLR